MSGHPVTSAAPVLEIENLGVEYVDAFQRTAAVRDLSLTVHAGEVYGIVGESGCGKTTAALACVRYLPAKTRLSGHIKFQGQDILSLSQRELRRLRGNRIAMVYQDSLAALNPALTIGLQMAEVLTTHQHATDAAARDACLEMLRRVHISDPALVLRRYPHQLSGGMQQRVVIAMALLLRPSLLIMDEPTTGLDVTIQAAVLDLVNDLRREFGTAILFISHNLGVIAGLCDRVGVMYAGEMVEEADIHSLFQAPKHPYTIGLLRCVPRLDASKQTYSLWSIPGRVPPLSDLPAGCVFAARCPMAQAECRERAPALLPVGRGRRSRCFFWDKLDPAVFAAQLPDRVSAPAAAGSLRGTELLDVADLRVHFRQSEGMFSLLGKQRKVLAVDGVTFSLPSRSTLSIVGESGSGKSTIARTIAGLTPLTAGQIRFDNQELKALVRRRQVSTLQALQMVFQNPDSTLNPQKTAADELRRSLRLFRVVPRAQEDAAIEQLLQAVGLNSSYGQRYPAQLSGGEKQRIAIARAFAGRPRLVLCDEPTSSLDVSVQSMVLNLLLRLQQDYGVSLLFISHDLSLVRYMSDFVAIIYLGKICQIGRVEQVFHPPYHPYTEALLSAVPIPNPAAQRSRIRLTGNIPSPVDPPRGCPFHTRCPRKVGPVCEQVAPPAQQQDGHIIYCHIPLAELSQLPAVLPA
ncbi:MAG: ABC transporter ATP-binding protein [Anaerolineales bacterium]|nr:ABC transporter ATP-binding protein [Anaerolineales bacterium]